jgi:hypothetical protein
VLPPDLQVDKLTAYQERELKQIKNWIYATRLKHRAERRHEDRVDEKKKEEAQRKEEPVLQPAMFKF